MEITGIEYSVGNVGSHKVGCDDAAIRKQRSWKFKRVEFGAVEIAIRKTDIEQHTVYHRKVDVGKIAAVKMGASQGNVIDPGFRKPAVVEAAIDERDAGEVAFGKITSVKNAIFEIGIHDFVFAEGFPESLVGAVSYHWME